MNDIFCGTPPSVLEMLQQSLQRAREDLAEHRRQAQGEQERAAKRLVMASNIERQIADLERSIELLEAKHEPAP